MLNTNNDWNIIGLVLSIDCFLYCSSCLLSKNMFNMIIKHAVQEPIETLGGHLLENTVLLRSIRPSRVPGLGGLDEIGSRSLVTAHLANVGIWFEK